MCTTRFDIQGVILNVFLKNHFSQKVNGTRNTPLSWQMPFQIFIFLNPSLSQSLLQYIYFLDTIDILNVTLRINAEEFSLLLKKNPEIES